MFSFSFAPGLSHPLAWRGKWPAKCNYPAHRRNDMEILWMLLIGLVVGALAKLIMPGRDPGGIIVTMLLGVAGAFLAGFLGRALGWYEPGEGAGFIASLIGAIILLAAYRAIRGRRTLTTRTV
jgi:uncharacterized membrane protein YeaQ/YmgE (transglycosylase-associated protein family)